MYNEQDICRSIINYFNSHFNNFSLNEDGEAIVIKLVNDFGPNNVVEAIKISCDQYILANRSEDENFDAVFSKLGGICYVRNQPEDLRKVYYIKGVIRNKLGNYDWLKAKVDELLEKYHKNNLDLDILLAFTKSKEMKNYTTLKEFIEKKLLDCIRF